MDDGQTDPHWTITLPEIYDYLKANQQRLFTPDDCISNPVTQALRAKYNVQFESDTYKSYWRGVTIVHTNDIIAFLLRCDQFMLNRLGRQILVYERVLNE